MKIQLLPSTLDEKGCATARQHLSCFIVDDCVAIDAGSLAMATTSRQKKLIRNVVLTHAHLDHIAGLPLFIDDLFTTLEVPVRVFATGDVIEIIERDIFNWDIYPKFIELKNKHGAVMEYEYFEAGGEFTVNHLKIKSVEVNHRVPTVGFVISDGEKTFAISSDTSEMNGFWDVVNAEKNLDALLIECAFPDELEELAHTSHHLTPKKMLEELNKLDCKTCPIYVINIKPMYYEEIVRQIENLKIENLEVFEVGKSYEL